jgi:hypothetical protein
MAVVSSWDSMPSCQRELERCNEQAGPDAVGAAAAGAGAGASMEAAWMVVRTAMTMGE